MDKDDIQRKKKEGWIETSFAIEVMAIKESVAKESLSKLVEDMSQVKGVAIYETGFSDIAKVKAPMKGVEEAYSQIATVNFFSKDVMTLVSLAITFGPSSIEIIGPNEKKISISELQNMMNLISGIIHQFAAAGIGGIVISPKKDEGNK